MGSDHIFYSLVSSDSSTRGKSQIWLQQASTEGHFKQKKKKKLPGRSLYQFLNKTLTITQLKKKKPPKLMPGEAQNHDIESFSIHMIRLILGQSNRWIWWQQS